MQNPRQVYTTFIRTTPKKLWAAITKPEFTRQYWAGLANISDWKKGSKWEHTTKENEVWITGKVLECVPPKRLVLSWADPDDLADKSRVTFEIEAIEDQVWLTVTHGNFKACSISLLTQALTLGFALASISDLGRRNRIVIVFDVTQVMYHSYRRPATP